MTRKKLLVADDSLTIQKVIRLALTNEGYEIHSVSDGKEALAQISLFRPNIVILDVSLPEKSAFDIRRELLSQSDLREIKCILMASAFEKVDEERYRELGFHGRLTKPFDPAHLRKVLQDVLDEKTETKLTRDDLPKLEPQPDLSTAPSASPPPPPPPSPPPPPKDSDFDADIHKLTEWTMNEVAAKSPVTLPPLDPLDTLGSTHPIPPSESEPDLPPLPEMVPSNGSNEVEIEFDAPAAELAPKSPEPVSAQFNNVDSLEIERLVRRQVEETLHRMAKQLLPEIAEKLVKQEIHRILSE